MIPLQLAIPLVFSGDRVKAALAPEHRKVRRVIYGIFDTVENKVIYVGKTGQELSKRISWYTCMVNKKRADKPVERGDLIKLLAADTDRYCFTILSRASQTESLSEVEKREIETHNPTMNSNRGGGGGSSFMSPSVSSRLLAPHHADSPITPAKNFPVVVEEDGHITAAITPTSKKLKNVIYRIRNLVTGKTYIGQTSSEFGKRMSSHMWRVNADETKIIRGAFHQEIADNPNNFDVGIIRHFDEDFNLDVLETEIIEHAKRNGLVYNKRKGGGGSKSSSSSNAPKQLRF